MHKYIYIYVYIYMDIYITRNAAPASPDGVPLPPMRDQPRAGILDHMPGKREGVCRACHDHAPPGVECEGETPGVGLGFQGFGLRVWG